MKIAELMKISMEMLKMMSKCGIKTDDWQHLEMLEEYHSMRENCEKFRYIMAYLSEKYRLSESTVKRIIKRLSGDVIL
jgi:DNA-binding MarR family transcriptional regulator